MPNEVNRQLSSEEYQIKMEQKQQLVESSQQLRSIEQYRENEKDALDTENRAILQLLDEESLWMNDEDTTFREKSLLRNRLARNYAGMVILDSKWYGEGSPEMVRVQERTKDLFALMDMPMGQQLEVKTAVLSEIMTRFDDAIASCRNYELKKNPWFSTGKRRKEQVTQLRAELERQRKVFSDALSPFLEGHLEDMNIETPQDLLLINFRDSTLDIREREAAKQEKSPFDFMDFQPYKSEQAERFFDANAEEGLGIGKVEYFEKMEARQKALSKIEAEQQQVQKDVDEYARALELRGIAYDVRTVPMPKNRKSVAERKAATSLEPVIRNYEMERKKGIVKYLKRYEGDDPLQKIKNDLKTEKDKRNALINDAMSSAFYSFYKELKYTKDDEEDFDKNRMDDPMLLSLLVKTGQENAEYNRQVFEAVFTKGITADNLKMEKLKPYIDGLVNEFLSFNISSRMLEDDYIASHAADITRYIKLASFLDSVNRGQHGMRSPFNMYYIHNTPPEVRGIIEQRIKGARPLFTAFKFKLLDLGLDSTDMDFDELDDIFKEKDPEKLFQARKSRPEDEREQVSDEEWRVNRYKEGIKEWNDKEKEFVKKAKSFVDAKKLSDQVTYTKEFYQRFGADLFYRNDLNQVKYLQDRVFGDAVYDLTNKDAEVIEHVFDHIMQAKFSSKDFTDPLLLFSPAKYSANKQLIRLVEQTNQGGRNLLQVYKGAKKANQTECHLSEDDIKALEAKIEDIKKAAVLYKELESLVENPMFDLDEFIQLTTKMSYDAAKEKIAEANDDLLGVSDVAFYNKILLFHKEVLNKKDAEPAKEEEEEEEGLRLQREDFDEAAPLAENESLTHRMTAISQQNDMCSNLEKKDMQRRLNRNRLVVLINDKHTLKSDSTEMTAIKKALDKLDAALHERIDDHEQGIETIYQAYQIAINAMEAYEAAKNPWFPEGQRRLRRVTELKEALRNEFALLRSEIRRALGEGDRNPEGLYCANDILLGIATTNADTYQEKFAVDNVKTFAGMQHNTGDLPEGVTEIRDAYSKMILSLQKDIVKVDNNNPATGIAYSDQISEIKSNIEEVVDKCNRQLEGKERESLEAAERDAYNEISSFRDRIKLLDDLILVQAGSVSKGLQEGTTYMDAVGLILQSQEKALITEKALLPVINGAYNDNLRSFLAVQRNFFLLKQQSADKAKYAAMDRIMGIQAKRAFSSENVQNQLMKQHADACIELNDAFNELVKSPVPQEFLRSTSDDPMDEALRTRFAYLRLRMHPAYDKIHEVESFMNINGNTDEAEGYYEKALEYQHSFDESIQKKIVQGGIIVRKIRDSYKMLNENAVNSYLEKVNRLELAKAKENIAPYFEHDFIGYREGELGEAQEIFNNEEQRIRQEVEKSGERIRTDYDKVRHIDSFRKEMSKEADKTAEKKKTVEEALRSRLSLEKLSEEELEEEKNKQTSLTRKQFINEKITGIRNQVITHQINLQDNININIAKKTDFATVRALSAFADKMDDDEFALFVKSYTGAGLEEDEAKQARVQFLHRLTDEILNINIDVYDIASDERILEKASELEIMSSKISAYRTLLSKTRFYNIYLQSMFTKDGVTRFDKINEKIHQLGDISRYYRVKKLIMTNPLYQKMPEQEISTEKSASDNFETRYLKKLQMYLDRMAEKIGNESEETIYTDYMYEQDEAEEKELMALEFESRFIPEDALKLTLKDIPKYNDKSHFALSLSAKAEGDMIIQKELINSDPNKLAVYNGIHKYKREDCEGKILDSPKFSNAKSFDGKTVFGDAFDRQIFAFSCVYSQGLAPAETIQMFKQMMNKYDKHYDETDPELVAYYESAFIEGTVGFQAALFAAAKREANAFGDLPFLLHPKDLLLQYTPERRASLMAASTITNHLSPSNEGRLLEFMKKFNTSGKYPINFEEFAILGTGYSQVLFKMNSYMRVIYNSVMFDDGKRLPVGTVDDVKKWCGKQADPKINVYANKDKTVPIDVFGLYLESEQKGWINSEGFLDTKDAKGNYVFLNSHALAERDFLGGDLTYMSELLKGNLIVHTSKEDVDAYEKKLKDEKYTSIGSSDDPYLINQFRKKLADFLVDKDGNKNYTGMGGHIDEFYSEEDKKKFEE